jgi:hypothetical protein
MDNEVNSDILVRQVGTISGLLPHAALLRADPNKLTIIDKKTSETSVNVAYGEVKWVSRTTYKKNYGFRISLESGKMFDIFFDSTLNNSNPALETYNELTNLNIAAATKAFNANEQQLLRPSKKEVLSDFAYRKKLELDFKMLMKSAGKYRSEFLTFRGFIWLAFFVGILVFVANLFMRQGR